MDIKNIAEGFLQQTRTVTLDQISKNIESDLSEPIQRRKSFKRKSNDWLSNYESFRELDLEAEGNMFDRSYSHIVHW